MLNSIQRNFMFNINNATANSFISTILVTSGVVIAPSIFTPVNAASLSFNINQFTGDNAEVKIALDDTIDPGSVKFTVEVVDPIADIRGVWFDISDDALLSGLSILGSDITKIEIDANNVNNLGGGNNLNGGGTLAPFDIGLEIGTPGIGMDDFQMTMFTVSHDTEILTLDNFVNLDFGVRLTSVGENREGSSKLAAVTPPKPTKPTPQSVPEPRTWLSLTLLGGVLKLVRNKNSD